ncbi:MAG: ECF transporter S component [Oscillospiraceae bacterium]|nr:ECF transporter S component [Oscillospiraceae bacterium]
MVRNSKTKMLVQLALLLAIIILLEVTNIGYPKIGIIELSLMPIPVVIGAIICGPIGGTILGCAFGITSFLQCLGKSAFGATLLAINPFFTFVVCVVTRTLMGFLAGLIFKMLSGFDKKGWWSMAVASFSGAFLNTLFFLSALVLCFGRSEFLNSLQLPIPWSGDIVMIGDNVFLFMVAFAGVNAIFEFIATTVVGTVICKPLAKFLGKTKDTTKTPSENETLA